MRYIGEKYNSLTIISRDEIKSRTKKRTYVNCLCDCGDTKSIYLQSVKGGITTSCGCLRKRTMRDIGKKNKKHGLWDHPLYNLFMKMKERCENKKNHAYHNYGGRGIRCTFEGPQQFIQWSLLNGYKKGLSIDRINNNGHYSVDNCRWVSAKTQCRNKRTNRMLRYNNEVKCVAEWAGVLGINVSTLYTRLRKGWSTKKALEYRNEN